MNDPGELRNPSDVIREFVRLWALGDLDAAFQLADPDVEYTLHLSGEHLPVGGVIRGRTDVEKGLRQARAMFDYLVWRPMRIVAVGTVVRVSVEFMYRHRPSGEVISGRFRLLFTVKDGLITRAEEFHDRAMFETFLKMNAAAPEAVAAH